MKITKTSPLSGNTHTLDIDVSPEVWERYRTGKFVPLGAFNHLSKGECRFLRDGVSPEEWEEMFEEEGCCRYDRPATRMFWIGYLITLVVTTVFSYLVFGG